MTTELAGNKKPGANAPGLLSILGSLLQNLNILRLQAFRALGHVELHRLTFLEATEALRLDGREMNEYIFAILAGDKTKTLSIVKPLYCSLFHCVCTFSLMFGGKILLRLRGG